MTGTDIKKESSGFLHHTGSSKEALILAFSALQHRCDPVFEFSRMLGERRDVDVIFIKDTENLWYQAGTNGAIGSIQQIVRYLREYVQDGYKRVVTMGASMGGYAALAIMPMMPKIDACLALAPQTFVDVENRIRYGDRRWPERMTIINNALKKTMFFDLKTLYMKLGYNGRTIHLIYGNDAHDRAHAIHMKDIAGVQLIEVAHADHYVGRKLKEQGNLEMIIDKVVRGEPIESIIKA